MSDLFTYPLVQPIDGNGEVMPGCKLYFYDAGTSKPRITYSDYALTIANSHPVTANADGVFPPIYIAGTTKYKFVLKTSADVLIQTLDNIATQKGLIQENIAEYAANLGLQVLGAQEVGVVTAIIHNSIPTGWLLSDGRTVGNAVSGATARANADVEKLFTHMWNTYDNTRLPVLPGGRGPNAAADFAAGKTIPLLKLNGVVIAGRDDMGGTAAGILSGSDRTGLDGTILGAIGGVQHHKLKGEESGTGKHSHETKISSFTGGGDPDKPLVAENNPDVAPTGTGKFGRQASEKDADKAHTNIQPTIVLNYIVKYADDVGQMPRFRGEWSSAYNYEKNDIVVHNGSSFICSVAHTNHEPPNLAFWLVFAASALLGWKDVWNNATSYTIGQTVRHVDATYVAVADNLNSAPARIGTTATNPNWDIIAIDGNPGASGDLVWKGAWGLGTVYSVNEAVTHNGASYICTVSNANREPPNALYWDVLAAKGETGATGPAGPMTKLEDDLTPKLGGDLIVNDKKIISASNGDIDLAPNGTGKVKIKGIYMPAADGSAGQGLRTNGAGQLYFAVVPVLSGTARGLRGKNNAAAPNNKVDITAEELIVKDGSGGDPIMLINVSVSADLTISGANGLDTGSEAASTHYYKWVAYNPSTTTAIGLFSLSSSAPLLPAGYTHKALVGSVRNDGSSNFVKYSQFDRRVFLAPQLIFTAQAGILAWTAQSIANAVPAIAAMARGTGGLSNSTAQAMAVAADANAVGEQPIAGSYASANIDGWVFTRSWELTLLTAQQIFWKATTTSALFRLEVTGFEF